MGKDDEMKKLFNIFTVLTILYIIVFYGILPDGLQGREPPVSDGPSNAAKPIVCTKRFPGYASTIRRSSHTQ